MTNDIQYFFRLLNIILDEINLQAENNSYQPDLSTREAFFQIVLKFERVSELFNYRFNRQDYSRAVEITKIRGYASISEISRELGLIYRESIEIILKMQEDGFITAPQDKRGYWVYIGEK